MDLQQRLDGLVAKDIDVKFDRHHLCSLCHFLTSKSGIVHRFSQPEPPEEESFAWHCTRENMIEEVLQGCHLCAFVAAQFGSGLIFPSSLCLRRILDESGDSQELEIIPRPLEESTVPVQPLKMVWYIEKQREHGPWSTPEQASLYTGSNASLAKAREWLMECQEEHDSCQYMQRSSRARPRRLLQVGKDSRSTIRVCLSESVAVQSEPEYLTLSHCWGKGSITRLKESDGSAFDALHRSIDFDSLPLTFQHAITITRTLGFEYLWIDSLCIIQDSKQDWNEQSAIMGAIYQGGTCNIAATGSKDGTGGCFATRNPLLYAFCKLSGSDFKPTAVVPPLRSYAASQPLFSRAWVFQERTMSPRTLHFGLCGIDWQCTEVNLSPTRAYYPRLKQTLYEMKSQRPPSLHFRIPDELWSFLKSWAEILASFSSCDITYAKDRPVALNGLVVEASRKSGLTSIAGLWKEVLPLELLWHRKEQIPLANSAVPEGDDATKIYIAPSWSWAACIAEITPHYLEVDRKGAYGDDTVTSNIHLRVLEVSATAESNGLVLPGAYIRVRGPARRVSWSECCSYHEDPWPWGNKSRNWYLDQAVHDLEEVHLVLGVRTADDFTMANFAYTLGAYPEDEVPSFRKINKVDYGLMLQQIHDQPGQFRRVGLFVQFHEYGDKEGHDERDGLLFPSSGLYSTMKTFSII